MTTTVPIHVPMSPLAKIMSLVTPGTVSMNNSGNG